MWTGLKANNEYSAQITPYGNKVNAEIITRDKDKGFYDNGLWLTVMDKSFSGSFTNEPREKDWIDANEWIEKQLNLIDKYGTVMVTKPKHLYDSERLANSL